MLLSDSSQARMGMIKDMRLGQVKLKDYDDYLDIYRAEGSGLKVVCISHFPKDLIPELFVEPTARSLREQLNKRKHLPSFREVAENSLSCRQEVENADEPIPLVCRLIQHIPIVAR